MRLIELDSFQHLRESDLWKREPFKENHVINGTIPLKPPHLIDANRKDFSKSVRSSLSHLILH